MSIEDLKKRKIKLLFVTFTEYIWFAFIQKGKLNVKNYSNISLDNL
jgi:hypothetical protein